MRAERLDVNQPEAEKAVHHRFQLLFCTDHAGQQHPHGDRGRAKVDRPPTWIDKYH
jgi:hypothetical protein